METYREVWLMTGNEEDFEVVENFLQEMEFDYSIELHLGPSQSFSLIAREEDR